MITKELIEKLMQLNPYNEIIVVVRTPDGDLCEEIVSVSSDNKFVQLNSRSFDSAFSNVIPFPCKRKK